MSSSLAAIATFLTGGSTRAAVARERAEGVGYREGGATEVVLNYHIVRLDICRVLLGPTFLRKQPAR